MEHIQSPNFPTGLPKNGDAVDFNSIKQDLVNFYSDLKSFKQIENSSLRRLTTLNSYNNRKNSQVSTFQNKVNSIENEKQTYSQNRIETIVQDEAAIRSTLLEISTQLENRKAQWSYIMSNQSEFNITNKEINEYNLYVNFIENLISQIENRLSQFEDGRVSTLVDSYSSKTTELNIIGVWIRESYSRLINGKKNWCHLNDQRTQLDNLNSHTNHLLLRNRNIVDIKIAKLDATIIGLNSEITAYNDLITLLDNTSETYSADLVTLEDEIVSRNYKISYITTKKTELEAKRSTMDSRLSNMEIEFNKYMSWASTELNGYSNSNQEAINSLNTVITTLEGMRTWLLDEMNTTPENILRAVQSSVISDTDLPSKLELENILDELRISLINSVSAYKSAQQLKNEGFPQLDKIEWLGGSKATIQVIDEKFEWACGKLINVCGQIAELQNLLTNCNNEISLINTSLSLNDSTFDSKIFDIENVNPLIDEFTYLSEWATIDSELEQLDVQFMDLVSQRDAFTGPQRKFGVKLDILYPYKAELEGFISWYPGYISESRSQQDQIKGQLDSQIEYLVNTFKDYKVINSRVNEGQPEIVLNYEFPLILTEMNFVGIVSEERDIWHF